ncbi:hypothetical protein A3C26_02350 [Candidatus Daviesbacteria bacterium RIFCSPHIGHO2_02_FULL_39_12]|uniref:Uncharacterized protein n=2 Tax=Candidatus Daviesiibacteriota TaxID=1752718 RepID=A0A1F5JA59_9BACT|nr:MAG: hypothetical protein A3C26_02350 [Candidatus Daviesbacteria bacterium RIFCSPHIGHO2_02_FULL_39_12]OGE71698.1 MAG: hypothetical protein A3H40_01660 [Candidatus Daviesbacteria bacterium RIFCSPLOWO2_02_FULL_38_15]
MTKKQLQKVVKQLVKVSFIDGKMVESNIIKSIKILKSQSKSQAILALSEYLRALKRKQREHTLFIETTSPLSVGQINKILKAVEKQVKITKVVTQINPEILGGFKLKIGDAIWDESLMGKIKQVKETIIS